MAAFLPDIRHASRQDVRLLSFLIDASVQDESSINCGVLERTHFPIARLRSGFLISADLSQHITFRDDLPTYGDAPVVISDQCVYCRDMMMRFGFIQESFQLENRGGDRLR